MVGSLLPIENEARVVINPMLREETERPLSLQLNAANFLEWSGCREPTEAHLRVPTYGDVARLVGWRQS